MLCLGFCAAYILKTAYIEEESAAYRHDRTHPQWRSMTYRTDTGLAGFDKPGPDKYNPLYINDYPPLVAA